MPGFTKLAVCLLATATLVAACDDGGTTSTGGTAGTGGTTSTGGTGGTTTGTAGSGGTGGSTSTGGTGGSTSTGGTGGTGGTTSTGGTGGSTTGTGGNGGNGGNGGSGGNNQPDNWGPPPLVTMPALPAPPDYSDHPTDAQGRIILSQGNGITWVVPNVPDAMSAREKCADLVAHCYEPGVRSLDACMLSAPSCVSAQPWTEAAPCCAAECFSAYSALRKAGIDPLTAYQKVLYDTPVCMPGVDAMLAGGAP